MSGKHMLTQEDFDKIDSLIVSRVTEIIGVVIEQLRKEDILPIKRDIAHIKEDLRSYKVYTTNQLDLQSERIQALENCKN